ncbi:Asp-tRNA(Asn)/Glu-tRNA(Gln) amidotransferase subunit GatA [Clostridium sp. D2Q-14]|uniref:Asp-tRNA(Asn)/Glu-tRNA(Gln) amidotransferase subunit GatA n=1 Tax=Anaeromonas gelatinilytica TaxID=2683194 RepID=UPI00193AE504|nr:Asp-tRNA(Asn)/Glu-tRNA(Gln) amidotransferase subunit GatA [Anaeromonas gelatinilytica]MBS4534713.1 Asp-tRNA(Asn)/Glu-tRNA(Gln) amidotransferase subunit GatA [Anaeromonas gelatinilytica]
MELFKLTIHELRDELNKRELTSEELVKNFFNRIEETEEDIKSFLLLDKENAIEEAKKIDEKRDKGENLGDLAGIPVAIKDNISTKGLKTTCGSKILNNYIAPYDATVIKNLREAGAIIVGKTNLDEFAMGSSTENSAFHTTRNPWDLERVPGGSSGGSAAAVSSYQVPFSLGSSTGGSVRQPAAFCGVVGLKPTYGLLSRYGLVAFASSLDQIGPLTRDVEDCAIVMNTLASHDKLDSTSVEVEKVDYTRNLKKDIKGLKIGVPKEYMGEGINKEVREKIEESIEIFKNLGAEVEEMSLPHSEYGLETYYILAPSEASSNLARFDGVRYGNRVENYDSVEELFTKTRSEGFGEEVKRRIMIGTYCLSSGYYDAYYNKAQRVRTLIKEDFEKAFDKYDVIISPTTPSTAFKIGEKNDNPLEMYLSDVLTVSVNVAGVPAISIPCGISKGMPVGLQIIGKAFDESKILNVAYNFEQKLKFNETPKFGGVK